jgi:hypothetical protein
MNFLIFITCLLSAAQALRIIPIETRHTPQTLEEVVFEKGLYHSETDPDQEIPPYLFTEEDLLGDLVGQQVDPEDETDID